MPDTFQPPTLPLAARLGDEITAAAAEGHAALVNLAAKTVEDRQVSRYGQVTWPADRKLLTKMSDHDLTYLIMNDPRA